MSPRLIHRQPGRSNAALVKQRWRAMQRRWGEDREVSDMTETQIYSLVRVLVLLLNMRDNTAPGSPTHARALGRQLGWSQGVLMPRLSRLESKGWIRSDVSVRAIKGKQYQVISYLITSAGEAAARVISPYLQELVTIQERDRRRV